MRRFFSRAGAVGVAIALSTVVLPATPATAASSADCDADRSVRLLTSPLPGDPRNNRIWVDPQSSTRLVVCFDIIFGALGSGAIIVDTGGTTLPIAMGNDPADCNLALVNPTDPVRVRLALNVLTSTVCITVEEVTITLTFGEPTIGGAPSMEIWRDGTFSWIDVAGCPVEYLLWQLNAGPNTCMLTNARIYP